MFSTKFRLRRRRAVVAALLLAGLGVAVAPAGALATSTPGGGPAPATSAVGANDASAAADSSPAAAAGTDATNGAVSQSYGANVTILGHGFGHGEGMGQWGAYGYATTYGWSWQQILGHYYGGTTLGSTDPNQYVSVRLQALDDRPFTAFVQDKGLLFTSADGLIGRYRSLVAVETATQGVYQVWGRSDATLCPNMAAPFGSAGWTLVSPAFTSSVASGKFLDVASASIDYATPDLTNLTGLCQPDGSVIYYRGVLRALNGTVGENRTVNVLPLDLYVRGVVPRESPASWGLAAGGAGENALEAQAVAARSFAVAGGNRYTYAKICDSQTCQVYGGAAKRTSVGAPLTSLEQTTSNTATTNTTGVVLVRGGVVVSAMYSSSTGGVTAGTVFPAVVDLGDAASPWHNWSVTIPVTTIQAKWPSIGQLLSIDVTRRNGLGEWGGRVLSLNLRGTAGTLALTGDQFRIGLGLRSNWFFVPDGCSGRTGGTPPAVGTPVSFQAVTPTRVLDTRSGLNTSAAPLQGGCVLPLHLAGLGGIPATGATAAELNVTIVGPVGGGYATVYPCAAGRPGTSSLNFGAGEVVPNLVTTAIDGDGFVCVFSSATAHVLVDVMGWYGGTTGSQFRPLAPVRLRDTRREAGGSGPLGFNGVLKVPVVGVAGVPAGTTAVALNVTVTREAAPGYLSAYPCESGPPASSNTNYVPGQTVASQVVVALGASGAVCFYTRSTTDVIVDLLGWFGPAGGTPGSLLTPLAPARLLDTRGAVGVKTTTPIPAGGTVTLAVGGRGGVPTTAKGVVLNLTSADSASNGFVTAYPCGHARPGASNENPSPARPVANQVMVPLGSTAVCLYTSVRTNLVADVTGFFS